MQKLAKMQQYYQTKKEFMGWKPRDLFLEPQKRKSEKERKVSSSL